MPSRGVMVDASVVVQWFTEEAGSAEALRLLRGPYRLTAPDFMAAEAANALWKKSRRGDVSGADVLAALSTLHNLGINWVTTLDAVAAATRLALDLGHPVYDCLYLILARTHGIPLATFDERLCRAAGLSNVSVFPLKGRA